MLQFIFSDNFINKYYMKNIRNRRKRLNRRTRRNKKGGEQTPPRDVPDSLFRRTFGTPRVTHRDLLITDILDRPAAFTRKYKPTPKIRKSPTSINNTKKKRFEGFSKIGP